MIAVQYGPFLDLGLSTSAAVALSKAKGAGDPDRYSKIRGSIFSFTLLWYGALASLVCAVLFFVDLSLSREWITGLSIIAVTVLFQQVQNLQIILWRAESDFRGVSLASLITSVISLAVLATSGFFSEKIYVVYLSLFLSYALAVVVTPRSASTWSFAWDAPLIRSLIGSGLGLLVMNVLTFLFTACDRLVVAHFYSPETLGQFNFSFYLINGASLIPTALTIVLLPHILEAAGAGADNRFFRELMQKVARYLARGVPVVLLSFSIAAEFLIPRFFEKYSQASDYLLPLCGVFYVFLLSSNYASFLISKRKQVWLTLIYGATLFLRIGLGASLAWTQQSITIFLSGGFFTALIASSAIIWLSERQLKDNPVSDGFFFRLLKDALPLLALTSLACFAGRVELGWQMGVLGYYLFSFIHFAFKNDGSYFKRKVNG